MSLLGYQAWKADKVESGECRQTIRARRKNRIKVGDTLHHYRGLRTKAARKVLESVCTETFPLTIRCGNEVVIQPDGSGKMRNVYCWSESVGIMEEIAKLDGFEDFNAMIEWFRKNHKMKNGIAEFDVIRW